MRTGILTFHAAHNYGAMLQAYALNSTLQNMGHDSHIVHYCTRQKAKALYPLKVSSSWRALLLGMQSLMPTGGTIRRRFSRFRDFLSSHQVLSDKRYYSFRGIQDDPPGYDAFLCGSDQIWNPHFGMDPTYFLRFLDTSSVKRIAYAASIGVELIPDDAADLLGRWISDIPDVSVREERGQWLIKELTGRDVPVVLDPTLLLSASEWERLAKPCESVQTPYLLVYGMVQDQLLLDIVEFVRDRLNLPVVSIQANPYIGNWIQSADVVVHDAGPLEYLWLFANAAFVCTNSFHGTAFSTIFQKPFAVARRKETYSRITGLLGRLQLQAQDIANEEGLASLPLEIDYKLTQSLLDRENDKSRSFLESALQPKRPVARRPT